MADLPAKPSLDHLRRQARDLLRTALPGGLGWDDGRADRAWSGKQDDAARSPTSGTNRTPPPEQGAGRRGQAGDAGTGDPRGAALARILGTPVPQAIIGTPPLSRDSPIPFPAGVAVTGSTRKGFRRLPSVASARPCGAIGAMSAFERLSRLVPRRSFELFEKLPSPGAGERNRTADLPLTRRTLCLLSYTGWLAVPWDGSPLS